MECHFDALPCTPFCLFEAFPLKGKRERYGLTYLHYCVRLPLSRKQNKPLYASLSLAPPAIKKAPSLPKGAFFDHHYFP